MGSLAAGAAGAAGVNPLWYATRATGVVALLLLTGTVVAGIAGTARAELPGLPRVVLAGVHRNLSLLAVGLVVIHVLTTVLDPFAGISLAAAVIPFSSAYRTVWLGLGAVALDLLLAVLLSSLVRDRLSYRSWRAVHWLAYASWPVALWHGLGTGTDTRLPVLLAVDVLCLATVAAAAGWRLSLAGPGPRRAAGITVLIGVPLATAVFTFLGPLQPGWARRAGTPAPLLAALGLVAPARLTAGWRRQDGPASLGQHEARYGPLPGAGGHREGGQDRDLAGAITEAGLTGRGGAGFPAGVKMQAVAARRGPAVVLANGMESEPASRKDQALLGRAPHLVLDGAVLAARAVGATAVHVCLDQARTAQVQAVWSAVQERALAGLGDVPITVQQLPCRYVASEETALISWLNGGEAKPTVTPPRPFERGVARRPTLVANVETLAHVALIARYGPAWFRRAGSPDAPGTMLVTISGAVRMPGVFEIEAGTPVGDVLAMAGPDPGGSLLLGGYFGTWHQAGDIARRPLSAAGLRPAGASAGAGVLLVLAAGGCGIAETARILRYLAQQGAQQCGPCRFGLPAIAGDFARLAASAADRDLLGRLGQRLRVIPGRGACRHPDGATRMAASALDAFADDVQAHAAGLACLGGGP
jgi:NADH:ubiquinone oxidoreductase subunit F (NADH-binding)